MPGTDHAGIATQMVVEKELKKTEKKSRHDLGRQEFLKRVWQWKDKYGKRIGEQHKYLGASLDWSRERFTMDEKSSAAVREVFVRLYEEGLIYRAQKLINWCPSCHTALSDLEVEHDEGKKGSLWHIRYPVKGSDRTLTVATTRPETMLGDTAVAIHPDDPRYAGLAGGTVILPLIDREIPIIADAELVNMEFGTGVVKVTPAHDFNDYQTGLRHNLPMISILDDNARTNKEAGAVRGPGPLRRAQEGPRGSLAAGPAGEGGAAHALGGHLPALQHGGGAAPVSAVVREDRAAGQAGHRGGGAGPHQVRPRVVDEHLLPVDAQHPRLVRQPPAVVGPPDPRLLLHRVQPARGRRHGSARSTRPR